MRKFWETKGKRILAFLLAVVVFACAIPNVGVVYAEEAQGTNVIISGTVLVPTDDDENPTAPYADAKVTVKYTATDDSEKTTAEVLTEDNGEYSVEIPDWKLEAGQIAEITIVPAEADVDVYETGTTTVDAGNVTDNAVIAAEVVLAKKETEPTPPPTLVTYTVSVSGGDDKGNTVVIMTADGEKESPLVVEENTAFSVVATPVEGYKITSVVVTNGGTELDHGDNWWSTSGANWTMSEEGIFEYNVASADKDYEVSVTFTEIDKYAVATTVNTAEYGTVEVLYVADASVVEDAGNIYEGEDVKVVARPNEKHEIIGISVQKDDGTGIYVDIPGCDVEGWWSTSGTNWTMGEDGSFTYILEDINAHYSFSVDYAGIPEYSISASVDGDGGDIVINDVNGVEQESGSLALRDEERTIIATPDDGYEIVSVTVKKDDGTGNYVEYIPDGLESDWWSTSGANWTMADGTFTYNISAVETGYEFSVKYAIQEVVVEGIVTYPDKYAEDGVSPYAEADVAIIYDGGKTVNTTTEVDGTYSVVIDDWLIGTDDEYSVVVTIKDGDSVKYTQSERNFSVSSGEAASRQIDREIALALVTYTISWTIDEGGELTLNDENTTYNGTNEIVVSYDDSYKLTVSIVDIYEHKFKYDSVHRAETLIQGGQYIEATTCGVELVGRVKVNSMIKPMFLKVTENMANEYRIPVDEKNRTFMGYTVLCKYIAPDGKTHIFASRGIWGEPDREYKGEKVKVYYSGKNFDKYHVALEEMR